MGKGWATGILQVGSTVDVPDEHPSMPAPFSHCAVSNPSHHVTDLDVHYSMPLAEYFVKDLALLILVKTGAAFTLDGYVFQDSTCYVFYHERTICLTLDSLSRIINGWIAVLTR